MKFTVNLWGNESVGVELEGDVTAAIDGAVLKPEALQHIIAYGFRQIIRDAGAISAAESAKPDADEKRNQLAQKKIDTLVSGNLRAGGGGQRLTPTERVARSIAEREVRAAIAAKGIAMKADKIAAYVKALLERDRDRLEGLAKVEIEEAAKRATIDLDDLLPQKA